MSPCEGGRVPDTASDPQAATGAHGLVFDQLGQVRSASELLAQRVTERVLDLVVQSLDVDTLLSHLDVNAVIAKIDVNELLSRVDVQALAERVDIDAIVRRTDVGAVIVMASGRATDHAVDALRGQGVALDNRIDGWVRRLLRRSPGLAGPPARLDPEAGT